jgi:hypothetical protein
LSCDIFSTKANSFYSLVQIKDYSFGIIKRAHEEENGCKVGQDGAGLLFDGSRISVLESLHKDYMRNKFSAWWLVYASYVSPAGSFCTATVSGLTKLFESQDDDADDQKKQRIFPYTSKSREGLY